MTVFVKRSKKTQEKIDAKIKESSVENEFKKAIERIFEISKANEPWHRQCRLEDMKSAVLAEFAKHEQGDEAHLAVLRAELGRYREAEAQWQKVIADYDQTQQNLRKQLAETQTRIKKATEFLDKTFEKEVTAFAYLTLKTILTQEKSKFVEEKQK